MHSSKAGVLWSFDISPSQCCPGYQRHNVLFFSSLSSHLCGAGNMLLFHDLTPFHLPFSGQRFGG